MGWALIILSSISIIGSLINLIYLTKSLNDLAPIFNETNVTLPSWANYYWVFIILLILVDFIIILFGRFLIKHPENNQKYLLLSIFLLLFILVGFPLLMYFLTLPIIQATFSIGQTRF